MKRTLAVLLVLGVVFACFAGGSAEAPKQESSVQAAIRDAQTLTWDQLLAKAKAEIGDNELSIYSNSSRLNEATFTEKTGIKVKADQPDDTQIYEKMEAEIGNGLYGADVYALQDSYMLMNFAIANGYLENYVPLDYKGSMDASATDPLVICYLSRLFIYNNGKGNLKNLITNVWQVTEPEFKGIEMKSPLLEKASRGVYTLPEAWEDEFVNVQSRFKRGIFSLETALFLCDLTDRTPMRFHMVFPEGYNLSGPKREGISCSGSREPLYSLGATFLKTPGGNTVSGYCAERALCDVLRPRNHTDIQIVTDAFKRYASGKHRNIPLLSEYAQILHVKEKLRAYLEVLL